MRHIQNQKGLTLIELLAAMAILLTTCGLFFSIFISVFQTNDRIQQKITAQQEANYIVSALTKMHQESQEYVINQPSPSEIELKDTKHPMNAVKLGNTGYEYSFMITPANSKETKNIFMNEKVTLTGPDAQTHLHVSLTVTNKENNKDTFTIVTTISRMTKAPD
ncbi:PulJ/GspJ family protein [Priestia taiwanensis]|uniref:Uncharacterized protein n=1 Tax=Priestia taiwanensis TaxID=1347902 RepID=A0A917AWH7_9BACI|nr:prepilin-type N-terminal cleavage/methylation domain-containing protein [Priestia taiwanensis]MBM7363590.1 prepilin-type N-terminal cleavage/methylation domain-containing protein [Priestia taiwanensis]GGE75808.1 hypothetical protein GCM10007140_26990 [Priestia taiwanensis]